MALSMAACGNKAEEVENNVSDTSVEESTEETIEESTEESVEETTEESSVVEDKTSTGEASEDVSVIEPGVVDEPTSETKPSVDPNVGGNTGNSGNNGNNSGNETPSSETSTTPPVVNPEPTNPPASSGNGDNLSFSGSVTLPSGLTISTLDEFNGAGMDTSAGNSFMGDIYSDIVAQNYETMADNFDAFNSVWPNSVTNGEQIWWRSDLSNMSASLELRRCGDHYKIIIRGPHLDNATAESMGWNIGNSGHDDAREALVVLLSTITPNCVEVKDLILRDMFSQTCISDSSYTRVGDCSIMASEWDFENGNFIMVYNIR